MLHKKHFEIINRLTGDYRIKIYGRELIGKVSLSQKNIALTLDELEDMGILKSEKKGNMKFFSLNLNNQLIKDIIILAELDKKIHFLEDNIKLREIFKDDTRTIGIFGSYAKGTEKPESDIDMFIIGGKKPKDYKQLGEVYNLYISIKYFTEKEFIRLAEKNNPLVSEIMENHILIFNIENLVRIAWRYYYGFD